VDHQEGQQTLAGLFIRDRTQRPPELGGGALLDGRDQALQRRRRRQQDLGLNQADGGQVEEDDVALAGDVGTDVEPADEPPVTRLVIEVAVADAFPDGGGMLEAHGGLSVALEG